MNAARRPTALLADDEPLLREKLAQQLAAAWPELEIVAQARNGREAVKLFEQHKPDVCFLDVHMPGLSGVEAARQIGRRAHVVFVTAFDRDAARPASNTEELLQALTAQLARLKEGGNLAGTESPLRWIRAQVGANVRLIAVEDVDYLRSDTKLTKVAFRDDAGRPVEALVRLGLKELLEQLDPTLFAQVHRSVVVNLRAVSHVTPGDHETADLHLKGRSEVLPVSRTHLHLFRQM